MVGEATLRGHLRALPVPGALDLLLGQEDLGAEVGLVEVSVVVVADLAATAAVSVVDLAALALVEVVGLVVGAVSGTRVMGLPLMALLQVLGAADAVVVLVEVADAMEMKAVVSETGTEDPVAPTTSLWAAGTELRTATAIVTETETATVGMLDVTTVTPGNARTKATATKIRGGGGGIEWTSCSMTTSRLGFVKRLPLLFALFV